MELSGVSEWDQALQKHTISLLDQSVDPRSFEARRDTLLWVVQRLRQFVEQTTNRRSASPNLATLLQTAVIPALDDFYPQDEAISITEELIEIICAVGQGHADIMRLMQKIGVFHTMVWVVMHPTTQKVAANCLGRLVNAPGRAGSVAQSATMEAGLQMEAPPAPPDPSQPESSAAGAARHAFEGSPCALLYKMLIAGDYQARIAAVRMLQSLVHTSLDGEQRAAQQNAVALYGNGAILMYLKLRLQQLYIELPSPQAAQELGHVLQLLAFAAEGCKPAQDKLGRLGTIQSLLGFLCTHQATATWDSQRQTIMAMIPLLQCHPANQAILHPHTSTVAAAVAAILQRLPATTPNVVPRRPAVTPSAASSAETPLQQHLRATTVAERSQPQTSALSAALSAQVQRPDETSPAARTSNMRRPSSSATQHTAHSLHQRQHITENAADASLATGQAGLLSAQQQNSMTAAAVLKQACLSLLLFLPVAELQPKAQLWLQHAADGPYLLRVFLSTAITHEPDAVRRVHARLVDCASTPSMADMLMSMASRRALLEGLVQAVQGNTATEAIQALGILMKQGPDGASILAASDAADLLVKCAMKMETVLFDSHREFSTLATSLIPDQATAAGIVVRCQAAILDSSSSLIRNRAMDIMRATAALSFDSTGHVVHAGSPQQATATGEEDDYADSFPQQQVQQAAAMAAGVARLLRSTSRSTGAESSANCHQQPVAEAASRSMSPHPTLIPSTGSAQNQESPAAGLPQSSVSSAQTAPGASLPSVVPTPDARQQQSADSDSAGTDRQPDEAGAAFATAQAALNERQRIASRAVDQLFAEVNNDPARADAAVLAAAAGDSPLAGVLRQQIVQKAMQELFGPEHGTSSSHSINPAAESNPAIDSASAPIARGGPIAAPTAQREQHLSGTPTAAAVAAALTGLSPAPGMQQASLSASAAPFADAASQQELVFEDPDSSPDSAAARQEALDRAMDDLIFAEEDDHDPSPGSGGTEDAQQSGHSEHDLADPALASSSPDALSEADLWTEASGSGSNDEADTAALQAAWQDVNDSLDAALHALQQQDSSDANSAQRRLLSAATQGATAARAAVNAAGALASSSEQQAPASANAPALGRRQGQGILGLPSLRIVARPGRAPAPPENHSPAAAVTVQVNTATPPSSPIALLDSHDMLQRMTDAMDDDDYHEGQNLLEFMPGIRSQVPPSQEMIEEYLRERDMVPRMLIDAEEEREGDDWKTEVPSFYAVNSAFRYGHVVHVREQTRCRRQIGFPERHSHSRWLRWMFRGTVGVTATALLGGLATNRVTWHAESDTSRRDDTSESDTDSDLESEIN